MNTDIKLRLQFFSFFLSVCLYLVLPPLNFFVLALPYLDLPLTHMHAVIPCRLTKKNLLSLHVPLGQREDEGGVLEHPLL